MEILVSQGGSQDASQPGREALQPRCSAATTNTNKQQVIPDYISALIASARIIIPV